MKPRPEEEGRRWLAQAENDWNAARHLRAGGFLALSCFHAQQSAEKAVKAYLYAQGAEEVWGHAVSQLLEDAATFDQSLEEFFKMGAVLDKLYIPTRYPNGLPGGLPSEAYTEDEAESALDRARQILDAIAQRI
ncbi:MAG: HEPN domain-containing protein [Desulfohalobiaceae bacterium]